MAALTLILFRFQEFEQYGQCMYNVTSRRVLVTIVAEEKQ
jgi:hypothetical protein